MNKVILSGRLVKDIEVKKNNVGVFTLAVPKTKDETIFVNCVTFEKTTEVVEKYSGKGKSITVLGSLDVNKWTDKDGHSRETYQINVSNVELPPKN